MRIRSRAFDYDEMAMSSLLLESTGRYSRIPLPPDASSFEKDRRAKKESGSYLYDAIGSVIPKELVYIRPLSKEEIMTQFIDSNAKAFERYDSNMRDILKGTGREHENNRKNLPIDHECFIENVRSNSMDHPRMIPIRLKLPLSQEEKVEPIVNDITKRLLDSMILGDKRSKKNKSRIHNVKDNRMIQKERKVEASCTSVCSFVQNTMNQIARNLKLEEGSMEESNITLMSRSANLHRYLEKKKNQWETDKYLRRSLRSVAKASHFSWNAMLLDQDHGIKMIVPNMEFSIRIDPNLPHTVELGTEPNDLSYRYIIETMSINKIMLLDHLKLTSTTSVPTMSTRKYHKLNMVLKCTSEPKVKIISSYMQTCKSLSPSDFMSKYCPVFQIKWHLNETLDDSNIYKDPMDIVPFKFVEDPPLPNQIKDDRLKNENDVHHIPNVSISWVNNENIDAFKNRGSLICKRKSRGKRNIEVSNSARNAEKKNLHILNGLHIFGLSRIVEKYKIDSLFLPLPTKVFTLNSMAGVVKLPLPSLLDHFFPLETRRRRSIPKISFKEIIRNNYDTRTGIPNIASFIKELPMQTTIQNDTLDDPMSLVQYLEMFNEHVANVGELLHLLSKTADLRALNANHSSSTTTVAHSPILHSDEPLKSNQVGKLPSPSFQADTKENSQLNHKMLKRERKQRKKEERKKRKREKKEEKRRKKQKKEKIDSSAKRKWAEEESALALREDKSSSDNILSEKVNDGVTTITVPKLHVGVTPMIVARKTYAVQTTVTEEVIFQGDPSSCETKPPREPLVQDQSIQDQVPRKARLTSPMTNSNHKNTKGLLNACKRDNTGSITIDSTGAVGITPPSDKKEISSMQFENDCIDNLHDIEHPSNIPSFDRIALDSPQYVGNSKESTWTEGNHIDANTNTSLPVLCSESFLELCSTTAADLSSGRWAVGCLDKKDADLHDSISLDEIKFALYDCSIVDACGVDFDLGHGTAIKLFSPPLSESISVYMKDFMRKMVHITSSGRYREIHLFILMDKISSPSHHVNEFCSLQNALIRQPGCNCENIRIHYMNQNVLPFNIARIILAFIPRDDHQSEYPLDNEIVTRSNFLLGIAPSLSAHECITLISKTISKPFAEVIFSFMERADEYGVKPLARAQLKACCRSSLGGSIF